MTEIHLENDIDLDLMCLVMDEFGLTNANYDQGSQVLKFESCKGTPPSSADIYALAQQLQAPPSLADLVAAKRAEINSLRDQRLADPDATVTVQLDGVDVVFQAGPRSMADLNDALTAFSAVGSTPAGYEWRDENNDNHPADLALLTSIAAAKAASNNPIWQQSWALKDALDAIDINTGTDAENRAAIEAIVWP